ncbi:hypothetical protein ACJIZ3_012286 [Penstemon smallii]|uniref:Uncharacterized protein n=1 Tax=Penstemon smallii TaxID=265156 RepID=A0ABD3ULM3_9LAMI
MKEKQDMITETIHTYIYLKLNNQFNNYCMYPHRTRIKALTDSKSIETPGVAPLYIPTKVSIKNSASASASASATARYSWINVSRISFLVLRTLFIAASKPLNLFIQPSQGMNSPILKLTSMLTPSFIMSATFLPCSISLIFFPNVDR